MRRMALLPTVIILTTSPGGAAAIGVPTAPTYAQSVTIQAVADTYVVQQQPTATFGTATKLAASNWSTPWHSEAYVRFAVPVPPAGQRIAAARVEFTFQKLSQQPARVDLRTLASTTWPEATTSYANRPVLGPVIASSQVQQGATTLAFDVTATLDSGARSFALTNPSQQSAAVVHSRETGATGPRLVIDYTRAGPLCGVSFLPEGLSWQQALQREDDLFNRLEAVRTFYDIDKGPDITWTSPVDTGDRVHVVSFKGTPAQHLNGDYDRELRQFFAGAPRNKDVYWSYFHEPEDNFTTAAAQAQYRAAWQHLADLADAVGNPRLHATLILMEWTVNPASGRNWRNYYPGDDVLDVFAWDIYNYPSRAAKGEYVSPAVLIDRVLAVNDELDLPFGVAEMGSHVASGDTDRSRRAAWIRGMNDYLTVNGSLWNLWFDIDWPNGDYRLRGDDPGRARWREFCS